MSNTTQTENQLRALPHRSGWTWIVESWHLYRRSIGNSTSVALTYLLLILLSGHIREAWVLVLPFGLSYLAGGLMLLTNKIEEDDSPEMGQLFVGFTKPFRAALFKLGLINLGGTMLTLSLMLVIGWFVGIPQIGVLDALRNLNHMMMFWAPLWPLFISLLFGLFIVNAITFFAAGHIVLRQKNVLDATNLASATFSMNWQPILRMLATLVLFICAVVIIFVLGIIVPKALAPLIGQAAAGSLAMLCILLPVAISVVVIFQLLLISHYRCFRSTLNESGN